MKKLLIIIIVVFVVPFVGFAQTAITNNGAIIRIEPSTFLRIEEEVINQNNGTITNNGTLNFTGDFTQTGVGSTYGGTGMLRLEGTTNQSISSDSPLTLTDLVVNSGQELELNDALTVSNSINLSNNGSIRLGDNNLTLGNAGAISGVDESNFIITDGTGSLERQVGSSAVNFPIGNAAYNPVTLTNAGTVDNFSVRVENEILNIYPSGSVQTSGVVGRAWYVEEDIVGGSDVNITVQWDETEEASGFDRTNSGISRWTGTDWDRSLVYTAATSVSGSTWTQSRDNITSFSPFGVEDSNEPLPITLLAFQAERLNSTQVALDWTTASEINNKGFEIEFSKNATDFEKVGFVDGAGNSNDILNYQSLIENSEAGYYRLKQIDFDGQFSYSPARFVESGTGKTILRIFPNPNFGKLTFDLGSYEGEVSLMVLSTEGKVVLDLRDSIDNINATLNQSLKLWTNGIYIFKVKAGNALFTQRLILQR